MAIVLECADCGRRYPSDFKKSWGKTKETSGAGPLMVCVNLVPDALGSGQLCGGVLAAISTTQAAADAVPALTPLA